MRILQINSFGNMSPGRVAADLYRAQRMAGMEGLVAFARGEIDADINHYRIGGKMGIHAHALLARLTDGAGDYSSRATRDLLHEIERYSPDIIHLHNLHGYYLNVRMLFDFLGGAGVPVVWTLHDCWAFTGHCAFFDTARCDRWRHGCGNCPKRNDYPASLIYDRSANNYQQKRAMFTGIDNLTLVTPSQWLKRLVHLSFMRDIPIEMIPNGIDTNVFCKTNSNFRDEYGLHHAFIVLGVAGTWSARKGLSDLVRLSKMLGSEYRVVVVGVSASQRKHLPKSMTAIPRIMDVRTLAGIYSSADVFVNPTYEDNAPLTNMEALSCGAPVLCYDTGGCAETVTPPMGEVVAPGDINALYRAIVRRKQQKNTQPFHSHSVPGFEAYLDLYRRLNRSKAGG